MSDLSHETSDDGFHEIQLSGKQLVFLFMATTTVIVIVFLCGVKVGRGARAAQLDDVDQSSMIAAPAPPTASSDAPAATAGQPATEPPAPASDSPDELSYHKRLQGDEPAEKLKPQRETKAEADPPPAAPARQAATPPAAAAPAADNLPTSGHSGTWAVQVIATKDRAIAASVLKKLIGKGYPAFLVNPPAGSSPAYFKVQVGRYNDRGEAEQISQRIKKEEQFQSWITR